MDKTLFQEIQDTYPNMNNTQIRNTLASFLFTGDDVFKLIRDLSGGERGRVSLAKLMLSDANFLLLDEPTNHLDITSKEILESALNRYTGTVLYVSHDRYFINRTATRILDLTGQSFVNYIGNYDYYLEKKEDVEGAFFAGRGSEAPKTASGSPADAGTGASSGTAASSSASDTGAKLDWKAQKEEQARIRKRQNELKKTEDAIHQLETRDSEINELLALEEVYTDVSRLMELNKEKDSISEKLEKTLRIMGGTGRGMKLKTYSGSSWSPFSLQGLFSCFLILALTGASKNTLMLWFFDPLLFHPVLCYGADGKGVKAWRRSMSGRG